MNVCLNKDTLSRSLSYSAAYKMAAFVYEKELFF